jgi:hypothetical protein
VRLTVQGTNIDTYRELDITKPNPLVTLWIGNRKQLSTNGPMKLYLTSKDIQPWTSSYERDWHMEFAPDPGNPLSNLLTNDTVSLATNWDFFLLHAPFIPNNTKIRGGELTVSLNSTARQFSIPSQTAIEQFGKFSDMKLIGNDQSTGLIVQPGY